MVSTGVDVLGGLCYRWSILRWIVSRIICRISISSITVVMATSAGTRTCVSVDLT